MQTRSFRDADRISVLGLGCSRVGSLNNPVPMREIRATLEMAAERGVTLFDTADIYGQGDSERELGRLARRHPGLFIVTKAGFVGGRVAGLVRIAKPLLRPLIRLRGRSGTVARLRAAMGAQDFAPATLRARVEDSRRRLGLDRLPGFLLHNPSAEVLADPRTAEVLEALRREGKVASYGASVETAEELARAVAIPGLSLLQIPVAVLERLVASPLQAEVKARGIAVLLREILARPGGTRHAGVEAALRAALAHDVVTSAVLGVSRRDHLADALRATALPGTA